MLNSINTGIAVAISKAYCSSADIICKSSLLARLTRTFDDATFNNFISTLSSKAYLTGSLQYLSLKTIPVVGWVRTIKFTYRDVITGQQGEVTKVLPMVMIDALTNSNNWHAVLNVFKNNLTFLKKNTDGTILFINNDYGYNIAYTTNPNIGGGGIVVTDPEYNPENNTGNNQTTIPINKDSQSLNINSYIVPGLLAIGLYFYLGQK